MAALLDHPPSEKRQPEFLMESYSLSMDRQERRSTRGTSSWACSKTHRVADVGGLENWPSNAHVFGAIDHPSSMLPQRRSRRN